MPWRSRLAPYTLPAPVGARGTPVPVERIRMLGAAAAGSASNATRIAGVTDGARGSGTRYQRRVAASNRPGTAVAGRDVGAGVDAGAVGVGVGVVAVGVQEAATRAKVNTRARYLKVR